MRSTNFPIGALFAIVFVLGITTQAHAGSCGSSDEKLSVWEIATLELKNATAVFSGRVVRFEWRERMPVNLQVRTSRVPWKTKVAILKVDKWWKTKLSGEVTLFTDEVLYANGNGGNSSGNYKFEEGRSYLVFSVGALNELRANKCAPTNPLELVPADFLEALGDGKEPLEKSKP